MSHIFAALNLLLYFYFGINHCKVFNFLRYKKIKTGIDRKYAELDTEKTNLGNYQTELNDAVDFGVYLFSYPHYQPRLAG